MSLSRRVVAECLGTAFLPAAVVGSGIMTEKLASGNIAIALLANTVATGATLTTLIFTFGPISSAHFNPAATLARAFTDTFAGIRLLDAPGFIVTQLLGAFVATILFRWLLPSLASEAKEVVFPRTDTGP
jgi:glycerol uptake facilitator-like aquaporin